MTKCKECLHRYICWAEEENCKDYLKDSSLDKNSSIFLLDDEPIVFPPR